MPSTIPSKKSGPTITLCYIAQSKQYAWQENRSIKIIRGWHCLIHHSQKHSHGRKSISSNECLMSIRYECHRNSRLVILLKREPEIPKLLRQALIWRFSSRRFLTDAIFSSDRQGRLQNDNWRGGDIHIFVFTNCKNNRFQKKLMMQNANIWISAPSIIDLPLPLLVARLYGFQSYNYCDCGWCLSYDIFANLNGRFRFGNFALNASLTAAMLCYN